VALLVIRHAVAMEREEWAPTGQPDEQRPLTEDGRREMKGVARQLRRIIPEIDVLATSPLVRARQTAEIVAKAYDQMEIATVDALSPGGSRPKILAWMRERADQRMAVVGHAPDLDQLVAWLVTGQSKPFLALRKGGACLLSLSTNDLAPGHAELRWLITPKLVRRLRG
jgi:phosphohistidine phosphatase